MAPEENVRLIQQLFEAFSRGSIGDILVAVTDDVDWEGPVSQHAGSLPWAGARRGPGEVADYFRQLAASSQWHPMEDVVFTAAGDRVVVEGRNRNIARATGKPYEHAWVMVFTFRAGKITRFRHYYDPADITHALS